MKLKSFTEIKQDFLLPNLTYLDNATRTYPLKTVIDSYNHNSVDFEHVRESIRSFINAKKSSEVIFTSGVIHGLNTIANSICTKWGFRDTVIIPESEPSYNSDLWNKLSFRYNFDFKKVNVIKDGSLDLGHLEEILEECTGKILFSISHASESIGNVQPIKELFSKIREYDGLTILDVSNTIGKEIIDVQDLDADFVLFNGQNIYGPTGVGVLYGKHKKLEKLSSLFYDEDEKLLPEKLENFETNVQGIIALGRAVDWHLDQDMQSISARYLLLNADVQMMLGSLDFVKIFHPSYYKSGIISFSMNDCFPLDVEEKLLSQGIQVKCGFLNSKNIIEEKFSNGIIRVSWALYNDKSDIEKLENSLKSCYK
jgi:cysteine desulfurase/selenocysteine lyase